MSAYVRNFEKTTWLVAPKKIVELEALDLLGYYYDDLTILYLGEWSELSIGLYLGRYTHGVVSVKSCPWY